MESEHLEAEQQECSAKVPGGRCLLVGDGECWCEDAKIDDCSCSKPGGCPQGQYGEHAGWELCGYEEGYEGTYFPATEEVAEVFGYRLSNSPSCAQNSLRSGGSITPLSCPKHEGHCKNGFCDWLTQKDAWNMKRCGVQVCCTAFVRCTNMDLPGTIKTTTESSYIVTPLPPMDPNLKKILPESSKMIYIGEGWKYFKIPIPAGNFKITGPKVADVCKQYSEYGMDAPCASRKSCTKQKQCVETSHTNGGCTHNIFKLQKAIAEKGYKATDEDHLLYTFVYSSMDEDEDGIDGACGYMPGYCRQGEETQSDGDKFALCSIQDDTVLDDVQEIVNNVVNDDVYDDVYDNVFS